VSLLGGFSVTTIGSRALWLALSASVVLGAGMAAAHVLGEPRAILGSDRGMRARVASGASGSVTIDALPYERTVTCTGTYALTGTFSGAVPSWSASPSGESGSCSDSGGGNYSCNVTVSPDAAGEGVEMITVTTGSASATATIGFYVAGAHSCFLSQSINGSYNAGMVNLDAVTTWVNLGTSAKNVTQATASAKPTYRTSIVNGQPVVRCDGGDRVAASTASDWIFAHDGSGSTVDAVTSVTNTGNNTTAATYANSANPGFTFRSLTTAQRSVVVSTPSGFIINSTTANNVFAINKFYQLTMTLASANAPDMTQYLNGTSISSANASAGFSSANPQGPLTICDNHAGAVPMTGDVFRLVVYQFALSSTQRAINRDVDEWALGGTLPVTP
jgi:hypothetical protein